MSPVLSIASTPQYFAQALASVLHNAYCMMCSAPDRVCSPRERPAIPHRLLRHDEYMSDRREP